MLLRLNVRDEVAHRRVFERVNDVRYIHGLLLLMIVIDTQWAGGVQVVHPSFLRPDMGRPVEIVKTFAELPLQGPSIYVQQKGVQQCSIEK